jgi:ATP-dependent DNA helicase RecQ
LVLFDPADRVSLGWAIRSAGQPGGDALQEGERLRQEQAQRQLRRMESVAEGEDCREQALLLAVGELVPPCGRCDSCLRRSRAIDWSIQVQIVLQALEARRGRDLRSLAEQLADGSGLDQERWAWLARRLVQEELLSESDDGSQRLWLRPVGEHYLRDPWPLRWAA